MTRFDLGMQKHYDEDLGYRALYERALTTPVPRTPGHPFEIEDLFLAPDALGAALRRPLVQILDDQADGFAGAADLDDALLDSVLGALLDGALGAAIMARWGSHFWPLHFSMQRLRSSSEMAALQRPVNSSRWHCDAGPTHHLRIIVYLSDAAAHDSGTWVASRAWTLAAARTGYVFCHRDERVRDLAEILPGHPTEGVAECLRPDAGGGLLFEPGQILHRSQLPSYGHRDALHMGLVPGFAPWREFVREHADFLRTQGREHHFPRLM